MSLDPRVPHFEYVLVYHMPKGSSTSGRMIRPEVDLPANRVIAYFETQEKLELWFLLRLKSWHDPITRGPLSTVPEGVAPRSTWLTAHVIVEWLAPTGLVLYSFRDVYRDPGLLRLTTRPDPDAWEDWQKLHLKRAIKLVIKTDRLIRRAMHHYAFKVQELES